MNYAVLKKALLLCYVFLPIGFLANTCAFKPRPPAELIALFPRTPQEISEYTQTAIVRARDAAQKISEIPDNERTFENTLGAHDSLARDLKTAMMAMRVLHELSPEAPIREAAAKALIELNKIDIATTSACKVYLAKRNSEDLTIEQEYFCCEKEREFRRTGRDLPAEQEARVRELLQKMAVIGNSFNAAINIERPTVIVDELELAGLEPAFIEGLQKTGDGKRIVTTEYPVTRAVLRCCTISATREKVWRAKMHVAYPTNVQNLNELIAARDEYARIVGYESAAAWYCDDGMARSPEAVDTFLNDLAEYVREQCAKDLATIKTELPDDIELDAEGRFYPWDWVYVLSWHAAKYRQLDDQQIQEYFPAESTIAAVVNIYEEFFDCRFIPIPTDSRVFWHDSVQALRAESKEGQLLGYLLLDLYPRPAKYGHSVCVMGVAQGMTRDGIREPAVSVLVANFPSASLEKPALLMYGDVVNLFHEFGHAMHNLLSAPSIGTRSGVQVKRDFVEMPSQMFEGWMRDPDILRRISKHYKTGEPLPEACIERITEQSRFFSFDVIDLIVPSRLSLLAYGPGSVKDLHAIKRMLEDSYEPYIVPIDDAYWEYSLTHLYGYGPMFYGYVWSRVYAQDLFEQISKEGLLNPVVGKRFAEMVLAPGGTRDPQEMIEAFLGRKPSLEPFYRWIDGRKNK